jgi:hypothetical protein
MQVAIRRRFAVQLVGIVISHGQTLVEDGPYTIALLISKFEFARSAKSRLRRGRLISSRRRYPQFGAPNFRLEHVSRRSASMAANTLAVRKRGDRRLAIEGE